MGQRKWIAGQASALALMGGLALAASAARADEVVVFAAASLKNALDQVAQDFTAATGHQVVISYAGSNALAKQILQGAPADLFISASEPWMEEVVKGGQVVEGKSRNLLSNDLVLIASPEAAPVEITAGLDLVGLLGDRPLAMGLVDAVPAGQYGKASLQSLGLWTALEPKVAQADNVRAALTLVERGEASYGVVYASDAVASDKVKVVGVFPADSHPPILYPAALLTSAADEADRSFYETLFTPEAAKVFVSQGFDPVQ